MGFALLELQITSEDMVVGGVIEEASDGVFVDVAELLVKVEWLGCWGDWLGVEVEGVGFGEIG